MTRESSATNLSVGALPVCGAIHQRCGPSRSPSQACSSPKATHTVLRRRPRIIHPFSQQQTTIDDIDGELAVLVLVGEIAP